MRVELGGKRWNLVFKKMTDSAHGECDHPEKPKKQIRIRKDLKDRLQLEALIHEMLHACEWNLDEEWIHSTGYELSVVLWKLGWRETEDGS